VPNMVVPNAVCFIWGRSLMPRGRCCPRILAYVTGTVDQELLARKEYLAAENRILKAHLKGQLKLSDAERATLVSWGARSRRSCNCGAAGHHPGLVP
jgi:hypothetical protein